jgi:DNA modification methylase
VIYPFSILDSRTAEWKQRKNYWITNFGIQSELGREETQSKSGFWETSKNVSVFDPVLTELCYTWFCPPKGNILDPFAGGSVRGIVATELGFNYTGIDLSSKQILENRKQSDKPNWIIGDSNKELQKLDREYDFVFTCPPYHDLEVYSDDIHDLSNMKYTKFLKVLDNIIYKSEHKLKDNRFFGIVVSEIRDLTTTRNYKIGKYKNFVSNVIEMCERHNLHFYNDMILFNSQHQASRTAKTYFNRNRKIASVHQNILIFVKGNPDIATEEINGGEPVCRVNGKEYLSFRHAAIDIDPNELIATEVERRCKSTKSKYMDWQIIGSETKPNIKYTIDGVPFENIKQIHEKLGMPESMINNRIISNNPQFRHWKKTGISYQDMEYETMLQLQRELEIRDMLPIIECDGIPFYNQHDAGTYFGVSKERIRQKLQSDKFPTFKYLT